MPTRPHRVGEQRLFNGKVYTVIRFAPHVVIAQRNGRNIRRSTAGWMRLPLVAAAPTDLWCPGTLTLRYGRPDRLGFVRCKVCHRWFRPRPGQGLLPRHRP